MDCKVVNVVSPSQFWMINQNADDSFIKQIELLIQDEIRSGSITRVSGKDDSIKFVAVEVEDRKYQRGSISKRNKESSKVFLIDYGQFVEVENSKLYHLPDCVSSPDPLAFNVHLFGVFATEKVQTVEGKIERKITNDWSLESIQTITNLFTKNPFVFIREVEKKDCVIYADILIKSDGKEYSLRRLLEKKFDAIYSEAIFRKRVILSEKGSESSSKSSPKSIASSVMSNNTDNSEMMENTQKIKKWQEQNERSKHQEGADSSSAEKKENNTSSSSSNLSYSNQLSAIMKDTSKNELSTAEQLSRARALLKKRRSRNSAGSIKSEASTSSFKECEVDKNSKCSEPISKPNLSESGKASSCGEPSEIELHMNKSEVNVIDNPVKIFESEMPLKANDGNIQKKSIFEELLKEDRSQKTNADLKCRPAGKMIASVPKKSLKAKAWSPHSSDSSHSQGTQNSEKKDVAPEVKPPKVSSLKDAPIRKPLAEKNSAMSDVVRISHNRRKLGILEPRSKDKYYWPSIHEGVLRETISSNIPLDKPLILKTDSIEEIEPVKKINDLKISADIIKNLQRHGKYENLSSVQKYSINALRRNLNTVMISGAKTGKTLSYIMALIDSVQDKSDYEDLPLGNGPMVVILTSSSKSAHYVYEMCHKLLDNRSDRARRESKVQVLLAHGGGAEKELWVNLTNGCDILISTPHCLERLIECPLITNLERLCCLVIDEADVITKDPFLHKLLKILDSADCLTNSRRHMKNYQKVICSERWTPEVAQLVKTIANEHVIIFANFLEAAIYARLKPHLLLVFGEDKKSEVLFDKLGDKFGKQKILIICEDNKDVITLKEKIEKREKCKPIFAHDGLEPEDVKGAGNAWRNSHQKPIMICTDSVLHVLKIDDAEVLVHYSLPYKYKTNFGYRFSTLVKNYNIWLSDNKEVKDLKVYCLVDEFNHYQLPHIVEFAQRLGGKISDAVLDKCEEIKIKREIAKETRPLCFEMLEFGKCKNFKSCPRRHAFNQNLDAPLKSQPTAGTVSFLVLTVHDACHFSARILEHTDVNDVKTAFQNEYLLISVKLSQHFKKEENCIPHGLPKIGDICAVQDDKNNFYRAQIIEYAKVDQHDQPIEVNVRLMDKGDFLTKKNLDLFEIPKHLAEYPPQAVNIVLCGLLPMDFDCYWGQPSTDRARELLVGRRLKENEKWVGRIVLSLNNILCLDPVELTEHLSIVNVSINKFSLGEKLMKDNLAVFNENHLKMLYDLCEKGGISVPKYKQKKLDASNIKPQWAFFDKFFEKVYFRTAFDTSAVFVVLAKFRDLVKNLEADCNAEAGKILQRKTKPKVDVSPGKVCLAYYKEDQTWNRAKIQAQKNEWVEVFFVDHGDCHWIENYNLLPISDRLIAKLPFQAIECSLIGIDHETQTDATLDAIYDFSSDGCDLLYANVITKDLKPATTGGKKYEINLLTIDGISLSKKLVNEKLAEPLESQKNHLQDIEITLSDEEEEKCDDDDDEIWEDQVEKNNSEVSEENKTSVMNNNNEEIIKDDETEEKNEVDEYKGLTSGQIEAMLDSDEEANEFFQNLASKEFNSMGIVSAPRVFGIPKKDKAITEKGNKIEEVADSRRPPITSKLRKLFGWKKPEKKVTPEVKEKEVRQVPKIPMVVLPEGIFSPDVYWIQNHSVVNLRIILTDVKDYYLQVTSNKVLFCCDLKGKNYAVELRLFGAVCSKMTEVQLKAFHVEINLKKLSSETWPRLVIDNIKHPNIHFDVERVSEHKKPSVNDRVIAEIRYNEENGIVKTPIKAVKIRPVPYESSDSEDEDDDDDDENDDPYDPLFDRK